MSWIRGRFPDGLGACLAGEGGAPAHEDQRAEPLATALALQGVMASTAQAFAITTHVLQALGTVAPGVLQAALGKIVRAIDGYKA